MFLNSYVNGLTLGSFVYILGRCLDMTLSAESYLKLMAENGELLNDGLKASRKNLLGIGPVIYSVVDVMCVNHTLYFSLMQMSNIIIIHSIGYYIVHFAMHQSKNLKKYHNFHHKFDTMIIPSIGNAVSTEEFCSAYMLPFIVGATLVGPSSSSFVGGVGLISVFNLIIHCKELEHVKFLEIFVSPKKHILHHKTQLKHYSAPILDLEYLFAKCKD